MGFMVLLFPPQEEAGPGRGALPPPSPGETQEAELVEVTGHLAQRRLGQPGPYMMLPSGLLLTMQLATRGARPRPTDPGGKGKCPRVTLRGQRMSYPRLALH